MLEIKSTGLANSVQDLGRRGYLEIGVSRSGAMDAVAFRTANALLGNQDEDAAIEICIFPFKARFTQDTTFACTGADTVIRLDDVPIPCWWGRPVRAGQALTIEPPTQGARVYLAVAGGVDVPEVLGSRSTDLKGGFGGLEGRGLRRGDTLTAIGHDARRRMTVGLGCVPPEAELRRGANPSDAVALRVLPAAQYDEFGESARATFFGMGYQVTPESNRMGYRLSGQSLERSNSRELLSHGIVPGTVQVPPSGQPILQLAEANTCGGYPKIATVIEADLWKLGQARIGQQLRFEPIDLENAVELLKAQDTYQTALRKHLDLLGGRA